MLYLAIDGGGTKTEGILSDGDGVRLAHRVCGASNPHDVTLPRAVDVLTELVHTLLHDANLLATPEELSVYAGIAGVMSYRDEMCAALSDSLQTLCRNRFPTVRLTHLCIDSDVTILLAAEIPDGDGACVISGTGAVCFLRHGGKILRIGGWGNLLDSGGSGYNIGRDALEAALRAHDGRGAPTVLSDLLAAHLGKSVPDALRDIYDGGKTFVAACAPCVFEAAESGDAVAEAILERNAAALAELIETACRLCAPTDAPLPVILGGGLCQHCPRWSADIAAHLPDGLPVRLSVVSHPPVMGALALSMQQARP